MQASYMGWECVQLSLSYTPSMYEYMKNMYHNHKMEQYSLVIKQYHLDDMDKAKECYAN